MHLLGRVSSFPFPVSRLNNLNLNGKLPMLFLSGIKVVIVIDPLRRVFYDA